MKLSTHFPQTRREMRQDLNPSQSLLEQSGAIRPTDIAGHYILLPIGFKVHQKICQIIYEEMEKEGVQNLQLPVLQSRKLWEKTGRWEKYEASRLLFKSMEQHHQNELCLAPTAEELMTTLVASEIQSYRQLPFSLHQIGAKFRDELRPRMGLLRCREFSMSDAYSFDRDADGMKVSFEMFRRIYNRIFTRVGLKRFLSVQADSGTIGGQGSAEFMVLNDSGEDLLLTCSQCDFGANVEKAESLFPVFEYSQELEELKKESTPNVTTVEELKAFFPNISNHQMIKTVLFRVDPQSKGGTLVAVCIRGDLDINPTKLRNHLKADEVVPAEPQDILNATGARVGFAGPLGLKGMKNLFFDISCKNMKNFLCGYNTEDHHALNVNFGRDIEQPAEFPEFYTAKAGHHCHACGDTSKGILKESRGIEIGHIFMLQKGYSEMLDAKFLDETGVQQTMWMGCYGIGTTRLMQAVVADNFDDKGIIWPESIAPFRVHLLSTREDDPDQKTLGEALRKGLTERNVSFLYDDRPLRAGEKFNDADLIGCPTRITLGRKAKEGILECRDRATGKVEELTLEQAFNLFTNG